MIDYHGVAIEDVCAWPNLTILGDGEILATLFNKPAHGSVPGDTDCWISADGGRMWVEAQYGGCEAEPAVGPNELGGGARGARRLRCDLRRLAQPGRRFKPYGARHPHFP